MKTVNDVCQSIPEQVLDWKVQGKDRIFDRETIFDHINGGAELYLAYDFKRVCVRKYAAPGGDEMVLDIYDMGSSPEAFGIFSGEREEKAAGIGQGSEYGAGLLRFWQDRFFVSILAIGDEGRAEPAILKLGQVVATAIGSTGSEPPLGQFLPQENLDRESIRYFHTDLLLNKHYFLAHENILNLGRQTDCVLAEYPTANRDSALLLLVQYQDETQAQAAYKQFLRIYMPEGVNSGCARMENQRWTAARVDQRLLKIVFEAPDQRWAKSLLSSITNK